MDNSELRIGNWVLDLDGSEYQIASGADIDGKWEPMPITKERLLRFGFKKQRDILGLSDTWWHKGCGFNHIIDSRWSIKNSFNSDVLWVESVHEMQNLMFALNKKELAFEL